MDEKLESSGPISHEAALQQLGQALPEVDTDFDLISHISASLIESYQIKPEFFADQSKVLFFASLAQRLGKVRHEQDMPSEQRLAEEGFINEALALLLLDNSADYPKIKHDIDAEDILEPRTERSVYEKFKQPDLTAELEAAIDNGLISDVKQRLGITPDTEQPFRVYVLSVGNEDVAYGMQPPITPEMSADFNHPDWPETHEDFGLYGGYLRGLQKKAEEFKQAIGRDDELPAAWISHVEDETYLCIPQPYAEKLLYTDQPRSASYTKESYERDLAVLKHEYVHTQYGLSLDDKLFFGIGVEERRAELFSGDRAGYQDIKGFFLDIETLTGFSITELLAHNPRAERADIYRQLSKQFGLQGMLELALTCPVQYRSEARPYQKKIVEHLGGYDGFCTKLYEKEVARGAKEQIAERVRDRASILIARGSVWTNDYRRSFGLNTVTDLITRELEELGAIQR